MELNEVNKSEVDEVSFDERVLLATQTLNWFAVRQEKIFQQFRQIEAAKEKINDEETNKVFSDMVKNHQEVRDKVLKTLADLLEDWGNFIDGQDALDSVDEVVTQPAYDIFNNRYKQETQS